MATATPNLRKVAYRDARAAGIDPTTFIRQITQESGFNPNATSSAGAIGVAQFMPGTAAGLGVNPRDPISALKGAADLDASYIKKYGSFRNALIAYNAGPGAVGRSTLPAETQNYIRNILGGQGAGQTKLNAASNASLTNAASTPATSTSTTQVPDTSAYQHAQQLFAVRQLQEKQPTFGTNALLNVLPSQAPNQADYVKQVISTRRSPTSATAGTGAQHEPASGHESLGDSSGPVTIAPGAERAGVGLQKNLLTFLHTLAARSGRTVNVTTGTNHNQYVAGEPGVQSDHWTGNAADLGLGGDARENPTVAHQGDLIAAHAIALAADIPFAKALTIAHAGGVHDFNTKLGRVQVLWKTLVGGNHYNHVHIGVNPNA